MEVPFRRLSWLTAAFFTPAALSGWLYLCGLNWLPFAPWFVAAILLTIILTPLSWSDHSNTNMGKGLLGCLGFPMVMVGLALGVGFVAESTAPLRPLTGSLGVTASYLAVTLAMALANPEGLTLLLVLVHAWVATGLGLACAPTRYEHLFVLALALGVVSFGAGLLASLVRSASRSKPRSEGL